MSNSIGSSGAVVPQGEPPKTTEEELAAEASRLAANTSFDDRPTESHKTVVCYNSACSKYRVERKDGSDCDCKITRVKGAGDAGRGW